jgi:hypothetical protein
MASLRNEADVEQNFVRRLLEDFQYSDTQILPKQSLDALTIGGMRGHPRRNYKPDFGIRVSRKIRWIVEAKSPDEDLARPIRESAVFGRIDAAAHTSPLTRRTGLPSAFHRLTACTLQRA